MIIWLRGELREKERDGAVSSVVEHSTADREVAGSTPARPFTFMVFSFFYNK